MRNRGLVAVLSAIIPGVGQFYNGRTLDGVFWFIITPGLRIATVKGCPTAEKREEEQVSEIMGQLNDERLRMRGRGSPSNAPCFRLRLTRCLLWYGFESVADAPDAMNVGVVRRRLYAGPDAADVYVHCAAGGTPPACPRSPHQLSAAHGHP
jgi:hypothetical protein